MLVKVKFYSSLPTQNNDIYSVLTKYLFYEITVYWHHLFF